MNAWGRRRAHLTPDPVARQGGTPENAPQGETGACYELRTAAMRRLDGFYFLYGERRGAATPSGKLKAQADPAAYLKNQLAELTGRPLGEVDVKGRRGGGAWIINLPPTGAPLTARGYVDNLLTPYDPAAKRRPRRRKRK